MIFSISDTISFASDMAMRVYKLNKFRLIASSVKGAKINLTFYDGLATVSVTYPKLLIWDMMAQDGEYEPEEVQE